MMSNGDVCLPADLLIGWLRDRFPANSERQLAAASSRSLPQFTNPAADRHCRRQSIRCGRAHI